MGMGLIVVGGILIVFGLYWRNKLAKLKNRLEDVQREPGKREAALTDRTGTGGMG